MLYLFAPFLFAASLAMLPAIAQAPQQDPPILEVPANTAYAEPDPEAIHVSESDGITGWKDEREKVVWYGYFKNTGNLTVKVTISLPEIDISTLKLSVVSSYSMAVVHGRGTEPVTASFRDISISKPGYYRFELEGIQKTGATFGTIKSLRLIGPAAAGAHFNLKERRNAASVHLIYPTQSLDNSSIAWFYNEVTVQKDPIWSYYMACGFRRGYFGIQVNSPTERRIIFSVWDSGNEGVDRSKVKPDDQVQLVKKGDGVFAGGFGNEGTGGHSHLIYPWKTGQTYRFLVTAEPDGTHTTYTGYFYFPERRSWGLIASFRSPKDGTYLHGLYSFNENFGGPNGQKQRQAEFGNQWVKCTDGKWTELTTARFSCDGTGKADRLDYSSGVENGRFYLSNGGFTSNGVKFGDVLHRPAGGKFPEPLVLPK